MKEELAQLLGNRRTQDTGEDNVSFFRLEDDRDTHLLDALLKGNVSIKVLSMIESQMRDLIKLEHPQMRLGEAEYQSLLNEKLAGRRIEEYGVWIYYPWSRRLVQCLDEEEFIRVRTIRNRYKITQEEQELMRSKVIGIVGLSVGQSAALSLAMERVAGEIRIADFDLLELSNLNRIRTGVHQLGLQKTAIVKREILEIDPFIKVRVFSEGLHKGNMEDFFEANGPIDLLVEECDSPDIKVLARKYCKAHGIPVLMETSDRSMLDVERYDLDPDYPILHGLISEEFLNVTDWTEDLKRTIAMQSIDISKASERGVASLEEIGKSITTWPQLATDVIAGGAIVAIAAKMIFLNQGINSSRTYVDIPSIISK